MLIGVYVELILGLEAFIALCALEDLPRRVFDLNMLLYLVTMSKLLMTNLTTEATVLKLFVH